MAVVEFGGVGTVVHHTANTANVIGACNFAVVEIIFTMAVVVVHTNYTARGITRTCHIAVVVAVVDRSHIGR